MLKHNKKRNVGLLNEFFAQYMAGAAVEFRFDDYAKADQLWKKHFNKQSEMAKELRLFEAIYNSNLKDRNVAYNLLNTIKGKAKQQNQEKIDREKTNLIHEIRNELRDDGFFDRQIENYKTNATIQMVLNCWRTGEELKENSFSRVSHLEEKVIDHMVQEKKELPPLDNNLLQTSKEDIDRLVVNVFREKVENKYNEHLNEDQKQILGYYTFAGNTENSRNLLKKKLEEVRSCVIDGIEKEIKEANDRTPSKKLEEVRDCLVENKYNTEHPDEEAVTFYLSVCSLKHELESK